MLNILRPQRLFGSEQARELHRRFPPIDLHADPLMWARWGGYDLSKRHTAFLPGNAFFSHVDIPRLGDACMGAQFLGLVSVPDGRQGAFASVMQQLDILDRVVAQDPRRIMRAISAEDVDRAADEGRIAFLAGLEGVHGLSGELGHIETLAERGVRYLGLAHFTANKACCPAHGVGRDDREGLSLFGRDVIRLCEELGVIADLAHTNKKTMLQACAMARKPMIVSHTGIAGAHRHWRNIDDDQLRAVADTGGVVGVMYARLYLGGDMSALVRHVEHVAAMVGLGHVALGSDFDGMIVPVRELKHAGMLPNLTDALLAAGLDDGDIGKILRGNVLGVLRAVPPAAAR